MPEALISKRRGRGEDAIYFAAAKNRYVGAISLGYRSDGRRVAKKVFGWTKQEVRDKLKALRADLDAGLKPSPTYTVAQAVDDWLHDGQDGRSERTKTLYQGLMRPLMEHLGARPLRNLSASDVRWAMTQLARRFSSRSLQITRNCLERAITHAQANDLVGRNVAALVTLPKGRAGRPSKSSRCRAELAKPRSSSSPRRTNVPGRRLSGHPRCAGRRARQRAESSSTTSCARPARRPPPQHGPLAPR